MILVALGANLPGPAGSAAATVRAAMRRLDAGPARVAAASRVWKSPPWPPSDQPWYANAVVRLETALDAVALLAHLHALEQEFGRVRGMRNAARTLDLDLVDYDGQRRMPPQPAPALPHPRMEARAFVLLPLAEIAPAWRHPQSGVGVAELIAGLPADAICRPLPEPSP